MIRQEDKSVLFVGLGNPGPKYQMTRHNMGAIIIEALALCLGQALKEDKKFQAKSAKSALQKTIVHLLFPMTYMNESGISVRKYADYYQIVPSRVVVVCDDIALPFGKIRLREKGSSGGHNGLKSIQKHLGTDEYCRLRVGIAGDQHQNEDLSSFVLNKFTKQETQKLKPIVETCVDVLIQLTQHSVQEVMSQANKTISKKNNLTKGDEKI